MNKHTVLFLSSLLFCLASLSCAADSADTLPPDQAFRLAAKVVKKADSLLLSWDIADGYHLYRPKFKFVSLTPGIEVGVPVFPAVQTLHDKFFGDVVVFLGHLEGPPLNNLPPALGQH